MSRVVKQIMEAGRRETYSMIRRLGLLNLVTVGKNSSGYTSGEPEIMLPRATTAAPAMIPIPILPGAPLAAGDNHVVLDINGQLVAFRIGTVADALALSLQAADSPLWRGVAWAIPGNTVSQSANTERTSTETSANAASIKKKFRVGRPGSYRLTFDYHRTSPSQALARVIVLASDGSIVAATTQTSTASSTYVSVTHDMTINAYPGEVIAVQLWTDSGDAAFIQSCVLKYTLATSNPTIADVVLQD